MNVELKPFTEKMIARVTALLCEPAIERSYAIEQAPETLSEANPRADAGEACAAAELPAQTLRSRIERVLSEDAPRLPRMAKEAERLAAGGWGHSAFRAEVERVTREWAAAVCARDHARSRARQDEAPGRVD